MEIKLNGKPKQYQEKEMNIRMFLAQADLKHIDRVVVQLNKKMIRKAEYDTALIKEGDVVNILHMVGGG